MYGGAQSELAQREGLCMAFCVRMASIMPVYRNWYGEAGQGFRALGFCSQLELYSVSVNEMHTIGVAVCVAIGML